MKNKKILGKLIEEEVRKQQITITKFADMICCGRNNVYKIFERSSLHVDQLALISKVLNRNFFEELANNPSLVDVDSEGFLQEMEKRRAVSQFLEVVPNIVRKMNEQPIISFGRPLEIEEDIDIPDYMLTYYGISFTIGAYLAEKNAQKPLFEIKAYENTDGVKVYTVTNTLYGSRLIDVKLDYKTEEEWEKTLRFIFETFFDHENK